MSKAETDREKGILKIFTNAVIRSIEDRNVANNNKPRFVYEPAVKPADAGPDWVAPKHDATYAQLTAEVVKPPAAPKVKKDPNAPEPTAAEKAAAEAAEKAAKEAKAAEKKRLAALAPKKWFSTSADLAQNLDYIIKQFANEFDGVEVDDKDTIAQIAVKLRERWDTETFLAYFFEIGEVYASKFGTLLKEVKDPRGYIYATLASLLPQFSGREHVLATISAGYTASLKALAYASASLIFSRIATSIDGDVLSVPLSLHGLSVDQQYSWLSTVRERKVAPKKPKAEKAAAAPAPAK